MKLSTDLFASYKLLGAELVRRGYSFESSYENGKLIAVYIAPNGNVWKTRANKLQYPFISSKVYDLFENKAASYEFAAAQGIPIPFTHVLAAQNQLDPQQGAVLIERYTPLVVKPNDSLQSKGLTLNIQTTKDLLRAVDTAREVRGKDVVIQQQVAGEEIRFFVKKGKVIAALLRQTPRVVGDGVSSIKELIRQENEARKKLVFPYISYPQLTSNIIASEFIESNAVPAEKEVVEFSRATMIRNGCSVYEIANKIHQSYIEEIERFAPTLDTSFFVVDYLVNDYTKPTDSSNHWFLEFNSTPSIRLCHGCRDGAMLDIVPVLADLIEEVLM